MRTSATIFLSLSFALVSCGPPSTGPAATAKLVPDGITPGLAKSTNKTLYNLEFIDTVVDPVSHQPVSVPASEQLSVVGWAVDQPAQSEPSGVELVVDGKAYRCKTGLPRGDVADHFKVPEYLKSGFSFSAPAEAFGLGKHQVALRVVAKDGKIYYESPTLALNVQ